MNIPKERQVKSAKLAPYAEEGYLVGFEGSKIYCIYLPDRAQKIIQSLYCIFNKSEPLEDLETPENTDDLTWLLEEIRYIPKATS